MPSPYTGQCLTVNDVTFTHPAGGTGVAQTFQFRYEFATVTLYDLSSKVSYVVMLRPRGSASLVHIVVSGPTTVGSKSAPFSTCMSGILNVSAGSGYRFYSPDAILVRTEGRISVESFVFSDIATYLFFNYE